MPTTGANLSPHTAARAEEKSEYARLAEAITLHAKTEEQVTYPTAVLIGEYVRLRLGRAG